MVTNRTITYKRELITIKIGGVYVHLCVFVSEAKHSAKDSYCSVYMYVYCLHRMATAQLVVILTLQCIKTRKSDAVTDIKTNETSLCGQ